MPQKTLQRKLNLPDVSAVKLNYFGFARFNLAINFKFLQCKSVRNIFASDFEPDFITLLNSNYIRIKSEFLGGHFDHAHAALQAGRKVQAAGRRGSSVRNWRQRVFPLRTDWDN